MVAGRCMAVIARLQQADPCRVDGRGRRCPCRLTWRRRRHSGAPSWVEAVANVDEQLGELFLLEEPIDEHTLREAVRRATVRPPCACPHTNACALPCPLRGSAHPSAPPSWQCTLESVHGCVGAGHALKGSPCRAQWGVCAARAGEPGVCADLHGQRVQEQGRAAAAGRRHGLPALAQRGPQHRPGAAGVRLLLHHLWSLDDFRPREPAP